MNGVIKQGIVPLTAAYLCVAAQAGPILTVKSLSDVPVWIAADSTQQDIECLILVDRPTNLVNTGVIQSHTIGPFEALGYPLARQRPLALEAPSADQWLPAQRLGIEGLQIYASQLPEAVAAVYGSERVFVQLTGGSSSVDVRGWAAWQGSFPSDHGWADANYNQFYYSSLQDPYAGMSMESLPAGTYAYP